MLRYGYALLIAVTATLSAVDMATPASAAPFDGRWSVMIETDKGACDRAYRYGLVINNGKVSYAGGNDFEVTGRVTPTGNVHVRVARGPSYADGHGRLGRDSGAGVWKGFGGGECSGRWLAERR